MAAAGRAKAGLRKGLLDGVPISWKDLFDTAGIPTEAGSALLKGRTPTRDAAVLETATLSGPCLPWQDPHVGTRLLRPWPEPRHRHTRPA